MTDMISVNLISIAPYKINIQKGMNLAYRNNVLWMKFEIHIHFFVMYDIQSRKVSHHIESRRII